MKVLDEYGLDYVVEKIYDVINSGGSADYIVEEGTSGIWTYRKWASGIAECWGEYTYTNLPMTRQFGSGYITTGAYGAQGNFAFPFTFTKVEFVHYSATGSNVWVMYDNAPTTTNSGYCWIYKADASGTKTVTLHVNAKGLWKAFTPSAIQRDYLTPSSYSWSYLTLGNTLTTTSSRLLNNTSFKTSTGKFLILADASVYTSAKTSRLYLMADSTLVSTAVTNQTSQHYMPVMGIVNGVKGQTYNVAFYLASQDASTTATIPAYTSMHFVIIDI